VHKEPRQVGLKTIFDLVKQKPQYLIIGIVFTLISFGFGATLILVSLLGSEAPKVDYEQINENGTTTTAKITNIDIQENITINNEHPAIISYDFNNGDKEIENQYKSLDSYKINRMNVGDTIKVKYLAESSIVVGLEPFEFPYYIFLIIMIPLVTVGGIMLVLLYLRVRNTIALYRYGKIKDAEIVAMTPKHGLPISGIGQGVTVYYQYKTTRGENILGESFTNDYTILSSKKQGELIKIFVSLDNESKSCLISKLDQIRNNWTIEEQG